MLGTVLFSCKKDEQQNFFRGGKDLVLQSTPASGTFVFLRIDNANPFATFSWTNPEYVFSTGVSSQNVTYTLEAKLASSPTWIATKTVSSALSKVFTVKEINDEVLTPGTALNLDPGVAQNVQMRMRASLANAPETFTYSNVFSFTLTPYSNDPDLWITGDATTSSWTNTPPLPQKFTYNRATQKFTIIQAFVPGKYYKFLTTQGRWQPQWGLTSGATASGGSIAGNPDTQSGDPDAIPTPGVAGNYRITVDIINRTFTTVLVP